MNATITASGRRDTRWAIRPTLLFLLSLLILLATVAPASAAQLTGPDDLAQPTEPDDETTPQPESTGPDDVAQPTGSEDEVPPQPESPGPDDLAQPQPQPHINVADACNPDGFHYKLVHPGAPNGAVYATQWREAPNGAVHNLGIGSKSGFVQSGQGDFQVRGVIVNAGVPFHQFGWTDVTVFCPGLTQPEGEEPTVTIDVEPRCEPDAGIDYEIHVESPPQGALAYKAQWREPGGQVQTVDGQTGFIPTGEGDFEIRGVLHYQGPGFYPTDFVEVSVDCAGDPGGGGGGGGGTPADEPIPGNPNFTG